MASVGVDTNRIVIRGYGMDHPLATNTTAEGSARNRRVEITLLHAPATNLPMDMPQPDSATSEQRLEVESVAATAHFGLGSDSMETETIEHLDSVLAALRDRCVLRIALAGHADFVPVERAFADNSALSVARARAVGSWFVSNGIDSSRITYCGLGDEYTAASNATAEGRARNRRVEVRMDHTAGCKRPDINRAEIEISLGSSNLSALEEFRLAQSFPSGIATLRSDLRDSGRVVSGDSARIGIAWLGDMSAALPTPTISHPEWGLLPLIPGETDRVDPRLERWMVVFEDSAAVADTRSGAHGGAGEHVRDASAATFGSTSGPQQDARQQAGEPVSETANIARRRFVDRIAGIAAHVPRIRTPSPGQLAWIESPLDSSLSYRDRLTVLARGLAGTPMKLTVNDVEVEQTVVRPDARADFLNVPAPAGPVTLAIRQELPGGTVVQDSIHVHVVGPAARIAVEVAASALPADSVSRTQATVKAFDRWGMPLRDGQIVTVNIDHGTILTRDIYPEEPGVQLSLRGGEASVGIAAPGEVGEGRLTASIGNVSAQTSLNYTTPYEKVVMVGMAEGQIGWAKSRSAPAGVIPSSDFDGGAYSKGRSAVFARGTVGDGYLVTTSYDSDRRFDDRVLRFLTPERSYPIYGDASSVFYEAPTASRLFVRVEKDMSHVQYGDFATNLS